ncbi:MAG: hypothetical protein Kow0088_16100 [Anaerolineales bacterium]|jgi:hypothetical protein|nr:MAG: hypothetical protein DDG59_13285 [Anaerolineae bacterium]
MTTLAIKILALKKPQRYAVRRTLMAAYQHLQEELLLPPLQIEELTTSAEIMNYTQVTVYPSLVINERLVCVGRFPKKEEVLAWLREAAEGLKTTVNQ